VPQDEHGTITNTQRIDAALPTIRYVLEKGGSLVLMSHLGRPDGKRIEKLSLKPVAEKLQGIARTVRFSSCTIALAPTWKRLVRR